MRYIAWILFAISIVILVGSIPLAVGFWDVYGTPESLGAWWSQSWWVFAVAAVPAIAGYLVLRIANDRDKSRP